MPGYRRFVTYLFRYEKGRKGGNCGFAKVEVRQGKCRIEIQTKGYQDQELPVYLFAGKGEKPEGVYLGELMIKNGMGNAVFLTPAEMIGDTPYGIDDMRGLYLKEDSDRFIASQWDDTKVDWAAFAPYEERMGHAVNGLGGNEGIADEGSKKGMITKVEGEEGQSREIAGADEREENGEITGAVDREENGEITGVARKEKAEETTGAARKEKAEGTTGAPRKKESEGTTEADGKGETEETAEKQDSESELHVTQAASAAVQPDPDASAKQPYSNAGAWELHWQRFTAAHPVFRPFDEDEGVYGVKMNLRDFRILPKQYWCLANNSFLLHGYFNYRYVLFGYMGEEHKKWFLGVPGTFQNQEQILAGAFGFPEFRTKQLTRQKTGEFGYWYRYLDLGE